MQDLAHFLVALGAKIEGIGTNTIIVHGPATLGGTSYSIQPDHIEVGSLIGLAAVTRSPLRIAKAGVEHLRSIRMGFERLGIVCGVEGDDLVVPSGQTMKIHDDFGGHVPKLEDQPWPAFPADLMSIAIVTATQCDGVILMFEKMFESRMFFVDKLISMGGRIVLCDPHRAIVAGPSRLRGAPMTSPDIRAGMAMLLAAVAAEGTTTINNADQIERGYERIEERLNALGAKITRVPARDGRLEPQRAASLFQPPAVLLCCNDLARQNRTRIDHAAGLRGRARPSSRDRARRDAEARGADRADAARPDRDDDDRHCHDRPPRRRGGGSGGAGAYRASLSASPSAWAWCPPSRRWRRRRSARASRI